MFDLAEELDVFEGALERAVEAGFVAVDQGEFGAAGEIGEGSGEAVAGVLGAFSAASLRRSVSMHQRRRWRQTVAASSSTRLISMPSVGLIRSMYCWWRSAKVSAPSSVD